MPQSTFFPHTHALLSAWLLSPQAKDVPDALAISSAEFVRLLQTVTSGLQVSPPTSLLIDCSSLILCDPEASPLRLTLLLSQLTTPLPCVHQYNQSHSMIECHILTAHHAARRDELWGDGRPAVRTGGHSGGRVRDSSDGCRGALSGVMV